MRNETKQRIEKAAEALFMDSKIIRKEDYIAGALAEHIRLNKFFNLSAIDEEHTRAWNEAIDAAIEKVSEGVQFGHLETPIEFLRKELESLKR